MGWEPKTLLFYLTNNSDSTISGSFDVVDAVDMWWWLLACKANWQNEIFGKYWTFQQTWFSVWWGDVFSGSVTLKFPEWYSGDYLWCLTYTPYWNEETGFVNSQPRKALFIKAILNATASLYQLKVFPWSRSQWNLDNVWEVRFYDSSKNLIYSTGIISDLVWIAEFSALIPDGLYTVVYKWQSHLASYLYNISVIAWNTYMFDFTTWDKLYGVQNFNNVNDDWYRYQIAWDLENIYWVYDFEINANDIAIIVPKWENVVNDCDPVADCASKDLNWDWVINTLDLTIIWVNFAKKDIFYDGGAYMFSWRWYEL